MEKVKPSKFEVAQVMLANFPSFMVHLDPRRGAKVPPHLQYKDHICLQVGRDLAVPIPDLILDQDGISGTLTFGPNGAHHCVIPFESVFGMIEPNGHGMAWTEDAPTENNSRNVFSITEARERRPIVRRNTEKKERPSYLRLVN